MAMLNELVTALTLEVDSKAFKDLSKLQAGLSSLETGFKALGNIFTGKKTFSELLFGSSSDAQKMINTSERLGLSLKNIQQWQFAAKSVGATSSSVVSDIAKLQKTYGMSLNSILNLADHIKRANPFETQALQGFYRISDDTVTLFKKGKKIIIEFFEAADKTLISDEEVKKLSDMNVKINQVKENFANMATKVISSYAPSIDKVIEKFQVWISEEENVKKLLNTITGSILFLAGAQVLGSIGSLITGIANITKAFILLRNTVLVVGAITTTFLKTLITGITPVLLALGVAWSMAAAVKEWNYEKKYAKANFAEKQKLAEERQKRVDITAGLEKAVGMLKDAVMPDWDVIKQGLSSDTTTNELKNLEGEVRKISGNLEIQKKEIKQNNTVPGFSTSNQTNNNVTNNNNITIQTNDIAGAIRSVVESGIDGGLSFDAVQ